MKRQRRARVRLGNTFRIWESGSAVNPCSWLDDKMLASIESVMNDLLQILSSRSTITAEEV